jgi:uncharacterized protein (TIGR03437 family)
MMPGRRGCLRSAITAVSLFPWAGYAQVNVVTANYGNDRSNANLQETMLAPANVAPGNFGKLGSFPVDGQVYGQPLYVSGVSIPGNGKHNVLYVATQHNSVFAYDADAVSSTNLLWHVNLGPSVPNTLFDDFYDVAPEIGILSTGAIDLQAGALYVVAETLQGSTPLFQLHALDIVTGKELMNGPATITAQLPGSGAATNNGTLAFDPMWHLQRPGLLLANGSVYFSFGSHGDQSPWHGWLFRYTASDLSQAPSVFNTTLSGEGGAIWQSGRGLAADATGSLYVITGNGDYDGVSNFSESVLKLSGDTLTPRDWYTPANWQDMTEYDADLSAGAALIPGTHLVVGGDKNGLLYLVNGDSMGGLGGAAQSFWAAETGGIFNFALWSRGNITYVFIPELFGSLKCYAVTGGKFSILPVSLSTGTSIETPFLGMSISANAAQDGTGILWVTTGNLGANGLPGTLHAYDASNLANELWNSDMTQGPDSLGMFAKFGNPTVANGKVYVPTWSNTVVAYGLLGARETAAAAPAIAAVQNAASFAQGAVSPGSMVTVFGQNLAGTSSLSLELDSAGNVATILGNSLVLFDGLPAPLIFAGPNQVSAIVPMGLSASTTQVQVEYAGQISNTLTLPVAPATPGIFTAGGAGTGQAAALNVDYSLNSASNPAAAGSVMILYATGAGPLTPQGLDGTIVTADNLPQPVLPLSVQVGGQPAAVLYSGGAPGEVQGVFQINIQLPPGVTGAKVPVVLTVGSAASQPGVTLAIR